MLMQAVASTTGHTAVTVSFPLLPLFLGLGLPLIAFVVLAIVVERLAGPKWLWLLWASSVAATLLLLWTRLIRNPTFARQPHPLGSVVGVVAMAGLLFGICFGPGALAAWRLGRHRPSPRPLWLQALGVFVATMLGLPVAVIIGMAAERFAVL